MLNSAQTLLVLGLYWGETKVDRQKKVINKLLDGIEVKLTSSKWAKMNKCSHDTALRDIQDLIEKGILKKSKSGGRSTSYEIAN